MEDLNDRLRKAATLVASLDASTADSLLSQLTPAEAAAVRAAAESLDEVDKIEQEALARELESRRIAAQLTRGNGAVELDIRSEPTSPAGMSPPADAPAPGSPAATTKAEPSDAQPFDFLHGVDTDDLCRYLQREHAQVVALVLSSLPPDQATEVLFSLPQEKQQEVILRLAQPGQIDPSSVKVIEAQLAEWMQRQRRSAAQQSASRELLTTLLSAAKPGRLQSLLGTLRDRAPLLADELATSLQPEGPSAPPPLTRCEPIPSQVFESPAPTAPKVSFADLQRLDTASLVTLFRSANPQLAVLALAGADESLLRRITSRLPRRAANQLRRDVRQLGPTRLSDVETAQAEIASLASHVFPGGC